jgi:hypothetical protein
MRSSYANDLAGNDIPGTNKSGYSTQALSMDPRRTEQYGEPRALLLIRNQHIFCPQQISAARSPIVETVELMTTGKTRPN